MVGTHESGSARVDTLRWAGGGELRFCECALCWANTPFWRYAALVANQAAREQPGPTPAVLAAEIWRILSAPPWRLWAWSAGRPALTRAVKGLLAEAARERWNVAQLYEAVLRGVALHWHDESTGR